MCHYSLYNLQLVALGASDYAPYLSLHGLPHVLLLRLHVAPCQQSHQKPDKSDSTSRNAMVDLLFVTTL